MSELYNDLLQAFKEIAEIEKNEDLKAAVEKSEKEASQKEKDIDENIYTGKPDKKKTKKQLDKELPWNVHLGAGNPAKGVSDFNHMNTPTVAADESLSSLEATRQQLINKSKNADIYARSNQDKGDSAKDENVYIYKSEISTKITGMYKRLNNIYDKFSRYASVETAKTAVNEYNALDKDALQLQRQISSDYTGNMKDLAELRAQIEYMKNYIKKDWPEVKLNEGTWSLPNTKDKAQQLVGLLRKNLYKRDTQKLYELIGDDNLWDDINARRYDVPINDLVERYLGSFINDYLTDNPKGWTKDSGWKEEWDIDSLKQLAPIVKRFISPENWSIILKK